MSSPTSKKGKRKRNSDRERNPTEPVLPAHLSPCLDPVELDRLERHYRRWVEESSRRDIRLARRRILLIFLLIRYTGAKLSEILALDPYTDIEGKVICFRNNVSEQKTCMRKIIISENLAQEIQAVLSDSEFARFFTNRFAVDPAFVRRKFYECAEACGFAKKLGGPEMIRRARAVELIHGNIPLPAVQRFLGLSSPNLRTADISYSEEELQQVTQFYMERESLRKTSARNTFLGKITHILRGDIQAQVTLITPAGYQITTLITNDSLDRLLLTVGRLVTAEVKAPLVFLQPGTLQTCSSADNCFQGEVIRVTKGKISTEYVIRIDDGTELCALTSSARGRELRLKIGDPAWVFFSCFAVVLHD
jgi:molybdate transport system regulatory protein